MKNAGILAFLFVTVFVGAYCQQSHNVTFGQRGIYDILLYKDYIIEPKKWFQKVTRDVTFPPKGAPNSKIISEIKVTDLIKDGTGGYATILSGGVGFRNVTIHFKSQRGSQMSFLLEIYGRYY